MPGFYKVLFGALLLCSMSCHKEALPAHPFAGAWSTAPLPLDGFIIQANDDETLTGLIFEPNSEGRNITTPFFEGHWSMSDDRKTLTLDFGTAVQYGIRTYDVFSVLDHSVVRLTIREKDNPTAPVLELER